jgi:hypothetical protein
MRTFLVLHESSPQPHYLLVCVYFDLLTYACFQRFLRNSCCETKFHSTNRRRCMNYFNIMIQIKAKPNFFLLTYLHNYISGTNKISSVAICNRGHRPVNTFFTYRILYKDVIFNQQRKLSTTIKFPVSLKFLI